MPQACQVGHSGPSHRALTAAVHRPLVLDSLSENHLEVQLEDTDAIITTRMLTQISGWAATMTAKGDLMIHHLRQ